MAAVDKDTELASWAPLAGATDNENPRAVYSLAVVGSNVYIGGIFKTLNGQPRNRLAAVDLTGALTSFNPNANDEVDTFMVVGSTLHVGGRFASIGATNRNGLAAIDLGSGALLPWDPNASCNLCNYGIRWPPRARRVYVVGSFTTIGDSPGLMRRRWTARPLMPPRGVRIGGGQQSGFAPFSRVVVSGLTVYLAGFFRNINGQGRNGLAAVVDATGAGTLLPWDLPALEPAERPRAMSAPYSLSATWCTSEGISAGSVLTRRCAIE